MRLRKLTVQNWRNVTLAKLAFEGRYYADLVSYEHDLRLLASR